MSTCAVTASGDSRRHRQRPPEQDPAVPLEPLRTLTGSEWWDLARTSRAPLAQWIAPLNPADYQVGLGRLVGEALGRWTGAFRVERWAFWKHGRLMGAVETRADVFGGADILRFAVRPDAHGRVERALVAAVCVRWRVRAGDRCWWSTAAIMSKGWPLWRPPVSKLNAIW